MGVTASRCLSRSLFFVVCSVCTAMLVFRCPDAFTHPQFYAEDGKYFFADAYNSGWSSLGGRANGYFHLYPRLLANLGLSVGVPVLWMPPLFVGGTYLVYVVLWVYIFHRIPLSVPGRLFAVLATALVPLGNETWMNLTNVQWTMSLLIPVIIWGDPSKRKWVAIVDGCLLTLACFTGPYALLIFPILLFQAIRERRTKRPTATWKMFAAIVALGAAACAISLGGYGSVSRTDPGGPWMSFIGAVQYLFFQLWYPVLSVAVSHVPFVLQLLLTVAALAFLRHVLGATGSWRSPFAFAVLALGGLYAGVTLISYRGDPGFLSPFDAGIRNFYLPAVLLTWACLHVPWRTARRYAFAWTIVFIWFIAQTVLFIGRSRSVDMHWSEYATRFGTEKLTVPLNPPGWSMDIKGPSEERMDLR